MADFSELKVAVIEKQGIILNKLTELSYRELIQLVASLSAIISNLENMYTESEILCNKIISEQMLYDHRTTFAKAESIMKSSEVYVKSKNIANLKQCALRAISLAKIHLQYYFLKEKIVSESLEGL